MDAQKTGALIRRLRLEKGWTQRQLADTVHVGDKAISKWERGMGSPDISLLTGLAEALGVHTDVLLLGSLEANGINGGNMKRINFYVCPDCGNVLYAEGPAAISCCGRPLDPLTPHPADEAHRLAVRDMEDEWYVTFPHEMRKDHFLRFIACVGIDRVLLVRLYPEQGGEARLPCIPRGKLFCCCSRDGLWAMS